MICDPNTEPSGRVQPVRSYPPASDKLHEHLTRQLQDLSFLALERCICQLLLAMGYSSSTILGRLHFKGSNPGGGADIEAFGISGVSSTRVLVQVKQFERLVQAKYVDELRGSILRMNAQQGIIITTSAFSGVARASANGSSIVPVRLIDGTELVKLLMRYRVGVRTGLEVVLKIDDGFFTELQGKQPAGKV